jgi:hypothetical protein
MYTHFFIIGKEARRKISQSMLNCLLALILCRILAFQLGCTNKRQWSKVISRGRNKTIWMEC